MKKYESHLLLAPLTNGKGDTDISEHIYDARVKFTADLKNHIVDVLSYNMMSLRSINNILFVGRPFIGDEESSLKAILLSMLDSELDEFKIDNLDTANVVEAIGAMRRGSAV